MSQQKLKNDAFDSITEPNIYALPAAYTNVNQVKAEHVYNSFPLKFENFYLRFYLEDKTQNMKLWMDYPPDTKIPVYNEKVYVKVLRLPKNVNLAFKNTENFADNVKKVKENKESLLDLNTNNKIENNANSNSNSRFNSTNSAGLNINVEKQVTNSNSSTSPVNSNSSKQQIPNPIKNKSSKNINLFTMEEVSNKSSGNAFNIGNIDLSEIGNKLKDDDNNNNNNNSNNFEFVSHDINPNSNNYQQNSGQNIQNGLFEAFNSSENIFNATSEKKTKKESSDSNNNNKNKKFSNDQMSELGNLDWSSSEKSNGISSGHTDQPHNILSNYAIDNIPSSLDEDTLKEKVDEVINKWKFGVNEKKNLRFLLGTFYEVWTQEPMWKDVSMQTLIEDKTIVKTLYKKALGQTHPDKNAKKNSKSKYIADVLYNILTQANAELPK